MIPLSTLCRDLTVSCVPLQVTASAGTRYTVDLLGQPRKAIHVLSRSQMSLISL